MGKILVIDDEEGIRFTFKIFLTQEGYSVVTAKDYHEGLGCLSESDFDLIFVDISLGDKTGLDIIREVRERNLSALVAIITGFPNFDTAVEALRLGVFDYVQKPVEKGTVLQVAKMALQQKALNDQKERTPASLKALLGSVKDGIVAVDRELKVVESNGAARNLCPYSSDARREVFGLGCEGRCAKLLQETIKKGTPDEISGVECRSPDGRGRILTLTTSPLFDSRGLCCGAFLVFRDDSHPVKYRSPSSQIDTQTISQALEKVHWNKTKASRLLGISRRTIYRRMKEYGISL